MPPWFRASILGFTSGTLGSCLLEITSGLKISFRASIPTRSALRSHYPYQLTLLLVVGLLLSNLKPHSMNPLSRIHLHLLEFTLGYQYQLSSFLNACLKYPLKNKH